MSDQVKRLREIGEIAVGAILEPCGLVWHPANELLLAADRIDELERDLATANAKLASKPDVAGLVARVQSLRSARHEYDDAPSSELLLLDAVVEALSAGGETVQPNESDALLSLSAQLAEKEDATHRYKGERDAARAECQMLKERIPDEGDTRNLKEANVKLRFEIAGAMSALNSAQKGYADLSKVSERMAAQLAEKEAECTKWKDEHHFQACLTKELLPYQERAVKAEAECEGLKAIYPLLASTWFYGGWKAETVNEQAMETVMREAGWWPFESEDALLAAIAAREKP